MHSSNSYFVAESTRKQLLNVAPDPKDVTWVAHNIDNVELDDEIIPGIPIKPPELQNLYNVVNEVY